MPMKSNPSRLDGAARKSHYELYPSLTMWQRGLRRLRGDRPTMAAIFIVLGFAVISLLAPIIATALNIDPNEIDVTNNYAPLFSDGHLLGTDELGRDHLSRLLYGGQVSLGIAFSAALLSLAIGLPIGVFAGYYGGKLDDFINWFIITLNSIPFLYLLAIISALLSPSPLTFVVILGILGWTGTTRLVRAESYSLKQREFVIAAQALGASKVRLMFQHIVPNIFSLLIVSLALSMGGLILTESALSFIGFGIKAPTPTWGNMLSGGFDYMRRAPHLLVLPGMLIAITVFCFYLIGDGLRDAFDPKITD